MLASLNTVGDQTRTHEELLALLKSSQNQTRAAENIVSNKLEKIIEDSHAIAFYRKKVEDYSTFCITTQIFPMSLGCHKV